MKFQRQFADNYRFPLAHLLALITLLLISCGSERRGPVKPMVVTSVTSQAYFVRRIGGDAVNVRVMIPPGANPASYEPTMEQMRALAKAALYVQIGHPHFPFEKAWLHTLISGRSELIVVNSSKGIDFHEEDPHIWVSVKNARAISKNIASGLKKIAPQHGEEFDRNLDRFLRETEDLDREIRAALAGIQGKRFYVFHPAWYTFATEYGLQQVAIEQDHKEPSPHDLQKIIEQAKSDGAKTIFVQPQISQTSARLIAREIGGDVVQIDPLGEDWIASMRHAAQSIARALSK